MVVIRGGSVTMADTYPLYPGNGEVKTVAYLDPPYPGQSYNHYRDHPDYDGEVDHFALIASLDQYDGWLLHTSSPSLYQILKYLDDCEVSGFRVMPWVKPFCAFKRNVPVAFAWEPVIIKPCRTPIVAHRVVMRDFISENIVMQKNLSGVKPEKVCMWAFEMLGMAPQDKLIDMFPGSGAVTDAWEKWRDNAHI